MNTSKLMAAFGLPLIAVSSMLSAASYQKPNCEPAPPAACNPDECCRTYCLGPENYGVNAAVRPRTCNGDWVFTIAGLYWNAHQDGMEYAIRTEVSEEDNPQFLINAKFLNPDFDWNGGFKLGVGYNTTCDGWDIGVVWTRYEGCASTHDEAERDDNQLLIPFWSNFSIFNDPIIIEPLFVTDIETKWDLDLNLVDIELGREFWNSKRLAIRPHIGLRYAKIDQKFHIQNKGGIFSIEDTPTVNDEVDLDNEFKGIGIRAGLNTVWNFGCGWAIYGETALSIVYGRFHVDHDEMTREAVVPFTKQKILETEDNFRVSRLIADLALGVQWSSLFCDCQYGFTVKLGWENHLFLDQNQMWRVPRIPTGDENVFQQRRGDLDTQGWTLTFVFDF